MWQNYVFFNALAPRGQMVTTFSIGFPPRLLCTQISPDSLNLLITQCTIDDEILKYAAQTIFRWGGKPLLIFTSKRLCLSGTFF